MSTWWSEKKNVRSYMEMVAGSEGILYLEKLLAILPEQSSLLELGMGPGKDLEILSRHYTVTGSDLSAHFLDLYREKHPEADLILLDAVSLGLPQSHSQILFDGITSNKVLVHLTPEQLRESLHRQLELIPPGGTLCHSFWTGTGSETFDGLYFHYWEEDSLKEIIPEECRLISLERYKEEEENDSFVLILQSRD